VTITGLGFVGSKHAVYLNRAAARKRPQVEVAAAAELLRRVGIVGRLRTTGWKGESRGCTCGDDR